MSPRSELVTVEFLHNSGLSCPTPVIFGKVTEKNKEMASSLWKRSHLVMGAPKTS